MRRGGVRYSPWIPARTSISGSFPPPPDTRVICSLVPPAAERGGWPRRCSGDSGPVAAGLEATAGAFANARRPRPSRPARPLALRRGAQSDGMRALVQAVQEPDPPRPIHALVSILGDKAWPEMLVILDQAIDRAYSRLLRRPTPPLTWIGCGAGSGTVPPACPRWMVAGPGFSGRLGPGAGCGHDHCDRLVSHRRRRHAEVLGLERSETAN